MHGAHNTAYELIETELNVCIDSDDYMPEDAVEKIITLWNKYGSDKVSGIIGLDSYTDGRIIGSKFQINLKVYTYLIYIINMESLEIKSLSIDTELTRQYPYPIFEE